MSHEELKIKLVNHSQHFTLLKLIGDPAINLEFGAFVESKITALCEEFAKVLNSAAEVEASYQRTIAGMDKERSLLIARRMEANQRAERYDCPRCMDGNRDYGIEGAGLPADYCDCTKGELLKAKDEARRLERELAEANERIVSFERCERCHGVGRIRASVSSDEGIFSSCPTCHGTGRRSEEK